MALKIHPNNFRFSPQNTVSSPSKLFKFKFTIDYLKNNKIKEQELSGEPFKIHQPSKQIC